jgi:glutamine amidotransferase
MSAHSDTLSDQPSVLVATERMDGESGWRDIDAGALIHVGTDLSIKTTRPFPSDPVHLLTLEDLNATEAQSQRP